MDKLTAVFECSSARFTDQFLFTAENLYRSLCGRTVATDVFAQNVDVVNAK